MDGVNQQGIEAQEATEAMEKREDTNTCGPTQLHMSLNVLESTVSIAMVKSLRQ